MKPAVIMMFRDESDILEKCLKHWRNLGVERFYLCDNASKDRSKEIARQFFVDTMATGIVIDEKATDWPGRRVINELHSTAQKYGCDWIFPADADEFLQLPEGFDTIQDWLSSYAVPENVFQYGELPYLNVLPDGRTNWQQPHRKVFGKFHFGWKVSMGNHVIENSDGPELHPLTAYYRHYSLRAYEQFRQKMVNYMTAFNQTKFTDHPHSQDFHRWKQQGERFFVERWEALTKAP